jgi:hypothetical protein
MGRRGLPFAELRDPVIVGVGKPGGYYILPPASSYGTTSYTLNRMFLYPFFFTRALKLDRIGIEITTAGSAGSVVRLGLYLASPDRSGFPEKLLIDAATVDTTTTGVKDATIDVLVPAGVVWAAAVAQVAAPVGRMTNMMHASGLSVFTSAPDNNVRPHLHRGSISGALPDPAGPEAGVGGINQGPRIHLRTT